MRLSFLLRRPRRRLTALAAAAAVLAVAAPSRADMVFSPLTGVRPGEVAAVPTNGGWTTTFIVALLSRAPDDGNNPSALEQMKANLIEELWYNTRAQLPNGTAAVANSNDAAFQLAIWEIIIGAVGPSARDAAYGLRVIGRKGDTFPGSASDPTTHRYPDDSVQGPATATPAPPGLTLAAVAAVSGGLAAGWRRYRSAGRPAV